MTTSETNDRVHSNFTMPINIHHREKPLKKHIEPCYTDSTCKYSNLDYLESKWVKLLQANININKTILLFYR